MTRSTQPSALCRAGLPAVHASSFNSHPRAQFFLSFTQRCKIKGHHMQTCLQLPGCMSRAASLQLPGCIVRGKGDAHMALGEAGLRPSYQGTLPPPLPLGCEPAAPGCCLPSSAATAPSSLNFLATLPTRQTQLTEQQRVRFNELLADAQQ